MLIASCSGRVPFYPPVSSDTPQRDSIPQMRYNFCDLFSNERNAEGTQLSRLADGPGIEMFDLHGCVREDCAQIKAGFVCTGSERDRFEPQCGQQFR
jgi:hypothetical protein